MTPPPPGADAVFGAGLPRARQYADLLCTEAVVRGLIGPRECERVWDRHLLNCAVIGELVAEGVHVADVGSGAGLPGIPLAIARPDLRVTLVEPMARRVAFLEHAVRDLALSGRVHIVRARGGEPAAGRDYDVVTARALAPLDRLLGWCLPMLRAGGRLLALKGSGAAAELGRVSDIDAEVHTVGAGVVHPPTTVVVVRAPAVRPSGSPRRAAKEGS